MDIKWKTKDDMFADARNDGFEINREEGYIIPPNSTEKIWLFEDHMEAFFIGFTLGFEHVAKQVAAN